MNFILPSEAKARYGAGFLARVQAGLQRGKGLHNLWLYRDGEIKQNYETALHNCCRAFGGI